MKVRTRQINWLLPFLQQPAYPSRHQAEYRYGVGLPAKKAKKAQHVTPHPEGWQVKLEGASNATKVCATQKQAIDKATKIAKNQHTEVVIHGKDGKIRAKDSYGNDPCRPKDTKH